jgi:hypothetical protein
MNSRTSLAAAGRIGGRSQEEGKEFVTQHHMKNPIEYIIVTAPFHADAATHEDLARKVNEKLIGIPRCCPAILHDRVLLDRFFDCFTDFAGVLLNPTKQFLELAFDALEFVIRELGSLLFQLALDDVKIAFDFKFCHKISRF